jgi:hypothetical protein
MPVRFLTAEQEHRYGRFAGSPSIEQFARYFHLDDADHEFVNARRQELPRLGCAVQLGTVRFLGTFLSDPTDVPEAVVAVMARQIGIADPSSFPLYRKGRVRWLHAAEIRNRYGYREFTEPLPRWRLIRWLYALCWTGTERPSVLFDRATAWLVAHKVLLPGASVLERLVARVRTRASQHLWRRLNAPVTPEQRRQLFRLLEVAEGERQTPFDRLR